MKIPHQKHIEEINKSAYNSLITKNPVPKPFVHKKVGGRPQTADPRAILEEPEEISLVGAVSPKKWHQQQQRYYDQNDPDIVFLNRFAQRSAEVAEKTVVVGPSQKRVATTEDKAVPETAENGEDNDGYIKDADEEDEALYNGFENIAQEVKPQNPKRNIQSAHPHFFANKLAETAGPVPGAGFRAPPFMPMTPQNVPRPTTVPLAVVNEIPARPAAPKFRYRSLRTSQSAKGSAFSIVGKPAKLCPRSPGDKPHLKKVLSSGNITADAGFKLYTTATTTKSVFSYDESQQPQQQQDSWLGKPKKPIQQINLVTEAFTRPATAAAVVSQHGRKKNVPLVMVQERPMSAQVPAAKRVPMGSLGYVATSYFKISTNHKRPISAAVNYLARQQKERTQNIDPRKTRATYLKYLKELEKGAQRFVLEEEVAVGADMIQKSEDSKKGKVLLGRARKTVRLKKKSGKQIKGGREQKGSRIEKTEDIIV